MSGSLQNDFNPQITSVMAFPVILKKLIELLKENPGACRSVKHVIVGGSVVAVSWSEALIRLLDLQSYRIRENIEILP